MKDGMKSMKKEFKKINLEEIEDVQDELADMLEQSDDIQEALGRTYNMPEIDEDELAAELDALGDEMALDDDTSYLDDVVKAPAAPDKEPGERFCIWSQDKDNLTHFFEFQAQNPLFPDSQRKTVKGSSWTNLAFLRFLNQSNSTHPYVFLWNIEIYLFFK